MRGPLWRQAGLGVPGPPVSTARREGESLWPLRAHGAQQGRHSCRGRYPMQQVLRASAGRVLGVQHLLGELALRGALTGGRQTRSISKQPPWPSSQVQGDSGCFFPGSHLGMISSQRAKPAPAETSKRGAPRWHGSPVPVASCYDVKLTLVKVVSGLDRPQEKWKTETFIIHRAPGGRSTQQAWRGHTGCQGRKQTERLDLGT